MMKWKQLRELLSHCQVWAIFCMCVCVALFCDFENGPKNSKATQDYKFPKQVDAVCAQSAF